LVTGEVAQRMGVVPEAKTVVVRLERVGAVVWDPRHGGWPMSALSLTRQTGPSTGAGSPCAGTGPTTNSRATTRQDHHGEA
jgi:hypothetical protein